MNYLTKSVLIFLVACFALGSVQAQKKSRKKHTTTKSKKAASAKKKGKASTKKPATKTIQLAAQPIVNTKPTETLPISSPSDTTVPRVVTITSAFKPSLQNAAKVNFTAATPVIDSSRIPVTYQIPSQNLFFSYQPVAIKPLALAVDSGYLWENDQYVKIGAGNFSSYMGEAALSFGDGKHAITNLRGHFMTSTGHLSAQQSAKWGMDILSIFNTKDNHEWTTHPYYESSTQYLYGYQPSTLAYSKDQLLQRFSTIGIDAGLQNKTANAYGITYHPQIQVYRFFDNRDGHENDFILKAPINKAFGKIYALDLGLEADMATLNFPQSSGAPSFNNNLYQVKPSFQFNTPNFKLNAGIIPSWDNKQYATLPNVTVQAKLSDINLVLEAGWVGSFQKNGYRSLAAYNPWIGPFSQIFNTKINEQYAGIKASVGDHFTYQLKASLLKFNNQPLFLNSTGDGKTFDIVYEPEMKAIRIHGELGYTEQENLMIMAGVTYTNYNSLTLNQKAWGLLPLEATGSLKWKLLKDLQVKADVFLWDGSPYRDSSFQSRKSQAVADLNLGAEFTLMPRLNLWLQMSNLLNSTYQRWNQYNVLGFTILGGVVYSFR